MMRRFLEVFQDSFRSLFRGCVPLAALLVGTPLMFTLLFGLIYDENVVNDIALTVYDEDQSSMSRMLIQAYGDNDRFHIVSYVSSEEEMKAEILAIIMYILKFHVLLPPASVSLLFHYTPLSMLSSSFLRPLAAGL